MLLLTIYGTKLTIYGTKFTIYGTRTYKRVTHMITCYVIMTRSACHFDKDFMALNQQPALLRQAIMPI